MSPMDLDAERADRDRRCVIVMAKEPLPGRAKTRLAAGVGAERAARLADAFVRDTIDACRGVEGVTPWVAMGDPDSRAYFERVAPDSELFVQPAGDLGVRLRSAFRRAFDARMERVVIVGSDMPQLRSVDLERALDATRDDAVTLGPADDGGYYLIGLARRVDDLFDGVAWSTPNVYDETVARAQAAGLGVTRLAEGFDVDTVVELEALEAMLRSDATLCPATRAALAGA